MLKIFNRLTVLLVMCLSLCGPKPAFAFDPPSLHFFANSDGTNDINLQVPLTDWHQANRFNFNTHDHRTVETMHGLESSWADAYWFTSYLGGEGDPSTAPTFNAYGTIDFEVIDFLNYFHAVNPKLAETFELSGYYGGRFVHLDQIYGFNLVLKL